MSEQNGGCKEKRRDAMIGSHAAVTQLSEASRQLLHANALKAQTIQPSLAVGGVQWRLGQKIPSDNFKIRGVI